MRAAVILSLFAGIRMGASELSPPAQYVAQLVAAFRLRVACACVVLTFDGADEVMYNPTMNLRKLLSGYGVFTSAASFWDPNMPFICKEMNSLAVALGSEETIGRFLTNASSSWKFANHKWLVIREENSTSPQSLVKGLYIPFDSELMFATPVNSNAFELEEVWMVAPRYPQRQRVFGSWSAEGKPSWDVLQTYDRRPDFEGHTLRIATFHTPEQWRECEKDETQPPCTYFCRIWITLCAALHCRSEVVPLPANSTWDDLEELVAGGHADLLVDWFSFTDKRQNNLRFLPAAFISKLVVFGRAEQPGAQAEGFAHPFHVSLWLATSAVALAAGLLLALGSSLGHLVERGAAADAAGTLAHGFLAAFALLCQQGVSPEPRAAGERLALLTLAVATPVLLAAYSGQLISHLSAGDAQLPFATYDDLLRAGGPPLIVNSRTYVRLYQDTRSEKLQRVYSLLLEPFLQPDPQPDEATRVRAACAGQAVLLNHLVLRQHLHAVGGEEGRRRGAHCELLHAPRTALPETLAMAQPRRPRSPYRRLLDTRMQRAREGGLLRRAAKRVWPEERYDQHASPHVELDTVAPLLLLYATGVVLAVATLLLERCLRRPSRPAPAPVNPRTPVPPTVGTRWGCCEWV